MNPRASILGILTGLAALVGLSFFFFSSSPDTSFTVVTLEALPEAARGPVEVEGVFRTSLGRWYERSIPILGGERRDRVALVPITSASWKPGEPIFALWMSETLPGPGEEGERVLRGVKVGLVEPEMAPDLPLAPGAVLLAHSEPGVSGWLWWGFCLTASVFAGLGVRAVWRRLEPLFSRVGR